MYIITIVHTIINYTLYYKPQGGVSSSSNEGRNKEGEGGASGISPLFHLPAEFFHPAAAAIPAPPRLRLSRGIRLTSPASWASLRSPGAHSRMLCTQVGGEGQNQIRTVRLDDTKTKKDFLRKRLQIINGERIHFRLCVIMLQLRFLIEKQLD